MPALFLQNSTMYAKIMLRLNKIRWDTKLIFSCFVTVNDVSQTIKQHWFTSVLSARRWANISPVLGYCVVFGASLNVGQRHRRRAKINQALVQSIVHEVLTRAELILTSTGDAGPTFNRHWVGVGLYSPPAVCTARPAAQQTWDVEPVLVWCWASIADGGPELEQHWVNVTCLLGVLTGYIMFRTSPGVKISKLLPNWLNLRTIYKKRVPPHQNT